LETDLGENEGVFLVLELAVESPAQPQQYVQSGPARAVAIAHPIQGLIKYHGLRDERLRLPFHDSISVCEDALHTRTKVEFDSVLKQDTLTIAGKIATPRELERAVTVLDKLRKMAKVETMARITSENSSGGKGLGYSASAFAALGRAAASALGLGNIDERTLSEIVRLGAGSASRSLTGSFSIWYANRNGRSYSEQIAPMNYADFSTVIVPIPSSIMTEQAHREVLSSPFFKPRLKYVRVALAEMKKAILEKDVEKICELTEIDTLNLHAVTMTGKRRLLVYEPQSIAVIHRVLELRDTGIPCWYSLDTGPSVFVNCRSRYANEVANGLKEITLINPIISNVGEKARLVDE
jgi:phosphomevalonate decarboxylase